MASDDMRHQALSPNVIKLGWAGFPPAADDHILAAEAHLDVKLPPSYREFLTVSNGWQFMADPYIVGLRPVEQIERFPVRNQEWLDIIKSFPADQNGSNIYSISNEELEATIEISESAEGTLLLNPNVVSPDGEMETWFFESELGIQRYPSFWEMMQHDFRLFLEFKEHDSRQLKPGKQAEMVVEKLSGLIYELEEKAASWRKTYPQNDFRLGEYEKGILSILEETIETIQGLQDHSSNPATLLKDIIHLTDAMEAEWVQAWPKQQKIGELIKAFANPDKAIYEGGRVEGMRETVAILRWFLNEDEPTAKES